MSLERRNGQLYYYRSVRDGQKVRKIYVGAGETARLSHEEDELSKAERKERREREKEELERLEALSAPLKELSEAAEILTHAHLIAAGYHRHKGEYRRARG